MTRAQLVKKINAAICGVAPGFFNDTGWAGYEKVHRALMSLEMVEVILEHAKYRHDENGVANGKEWLFTVYDGWNKVHVTVFAAGAGTVHCPLDRYDICAYAS